MMRSVIGVVRSSTKCYLAKFLASFFVECKYSIYNTERLQE